MQKKEMGAKIEEIGKLIRKERNNLGLTQEELGQKATVIATGGYSCVLFDTMKREFDYINPSLTLEGLKILYGMNCGECENDKQNNLKSTETAALL